MYICIYTDIVMILSLSLYMCVVYQQMQMDRKCQQITELEALLSLWERNRGR
jgi:hypothetical protein